MTEVVLVDETALANAYQVLAQTPAENVWLTNFTSENTREAYKRAVGEFIVSMGIESSEVLYGVSQAHIIAYREHLKAQGRSNATVSNRLSALSSLYKFLADKQLCPLNPVSGVKRPGRGTAGIGSGKTPALSRRHVRAMLDAPDITTLKGLRDRAILHVYFCTGGRCSEPASLKVNDLYVDGDYWVLRFTTKGEKINIVAIAAVEQPDNSDCLVALQEYLKASGHDDDLTAPLFQAVKFGRNEGKPLIRKRFYQIFKEYAAAVGLPANITPHSARATFITQAYEAGVAGESIQRTVGHSSITTTEGYNQTAKKHRKSAALSVNY